MTCLKNQLGRGDRYLQRSAEKAIKAMHERVERDGSLAFYCLKGIVTPTGTIHFDSITKTKTVEKLLRIGDIKSQWKIVEYLAEQLEKPGATVAKQAVSARRAVVDLLALLCNFDCERGQQKRQFVGGSDAEEKRHVLVPENSPVSQVVVSKLVEHAYFFGGEIPPLSEPSRQHLHEKLMGCLEYALRLGNIGRALLSFAISWCDLLDTRKDKNPSVEFDSESRSTLQNVHERLRGMDREHSLDEDKMKKKEKEKRREKEHLKAASKWSLSTDRKMPRDTESEDGPTAILVLLYQLTVLQVYHGEADAVEILKDLMEYHDNALEGNQLGGADMLVEILLSFASRSNKLFRRISLHAFASAASNITVGGLQSLTRVLESKENTQGQEEIFDAGDVHGNGDGGEGSGSVTEGSDREVDGAVSGIDSDIEMMSNGSVDAREKNGMAGSGSNDSEDDDEDEDKDADEIAAFEAKLAVALGTRKAEEDFGASDTSGSSSDVDMSDSAMEALDDTLAEVFRARRGAEQNKGKKKERKEARENMVGFKNRVLDLVEIYLRQEATNPLSLELVLPLLRCARMTKSRQLSEKAVGILREFCKGSRGKGKKKKKSKNNKKVEGNGTADTAGDDESSLPAVSDGGTRAMAILREIHGEAGQGGSNAHAAACSSASLLVVKTALAAPRGGRRASSPSSSPSMIRAVIAAYGETAHRMAHDRAWRGRESLGIDFWNWLGSVRGRF